MGEGYVYIMQSEKDHSLYFGSTNDVNRRLRQHNNAESASTGRKAPWKLLAVVKTDQAANARKIEQSLKARKRKITLGWFLHAIAEELGYINE